MHINNERIYFKSHCYFLPEIAIEAGPNNGDDATGADDRKEGEDIDDGHLKILIFDVLDFDVGPDWADPHHNKHKQNGAVLFYI